MIEGDFNVIRSEEEKVGGSHVYPNEYEYFAFCIISCDLVDVNYRGSPFTWWNGRIHNQSIFKRLDRYLINQDCLGYFVMVELEHLATTVSDHAPMLLSCGQKSNSPTRTFRFLKFWSERSKFHQVVKNSWVSEEIDVFINLKQKLKNTKTTLSNWSKVVLDIFSSNYLSGKKL